jgi:hypothetical protein
MSIWRDMTDPWPTEPPSSLPCPVCGGPVDYDARGLEEYKTLRDERDAARLELRALEWLLALQPSRHDLEAALWLAPRAAEAIANAGMSHDYASAATALGWEGT